jgi:hypothetical protein
MNVSVKIHVLFGAAIAIGVGAVGAAIGSYDLTRRGLSFVVPATKDSAKRKYSDLVASSSAIAVAGTVLGLREFLFKPYVPKPPALPLDNVGLMVSLRNAGVSARAMYFCNTW